MWKWLVIGWVVLLPGLSRAAPVPPPPDDYSGAQYIDGAGCVFLRHGTSWQERLDRDGARICGFPPSVSAVDPNAGPQPSTQERLAGILASDLRQGEWVSDPRPAEARRDPIPSAGDDLLTQDVARSLRARESIGAGMAGAGAVRVCDLLGYAPLDAGQRALRQDVTLGLCPGMGATAPGPQVTAVAKAAAPAPDRSTAALAPRPKAASGVAAKADRPRATQAKPTSRPTSEDSMAEMIPATARFVRIGGYSDGGNAMAVLRKLSAMGYPVGHRYEQHNGQRLRVIMAGPFTSRQSLIAALNQIRRNGYPRAAAR